MERINSQCLKFTEKVSFNIASEARYVYILSRQKLIKNAKNGFLASFWKPEACGQTVLPDRSVLIRQKNGGKCQNSKIQIRYIEWFLNNLSKYYLNFCAQILTFLERNLIQC